MDKLQLTGQNLDRVFNFRSGHFHAATFLVLSVKLPNLQIKTRPKQLLGSLPLVIVLTGLSVGYLCNVCMPVLTKLTDAARVFYSEFLVKRLNENEY